MRPPGNISIGDNTTNNNGINSMNNLGTQVPSFADRDLVDPKDAN